MKSKLREIKYLVKKGNTYLKINTLYIKPKDFIFFDEEGEDTAEIYGLSFSPWDITLESEIFIPVDSINAKLLEVVDKEEFYRELEKVIEKNY
jgi:hypothetical protein